MPSPVLHCGIFPVAMSKFAILGGVKSNAVKVIEVTKPHLEKNNTFENEEIFRIFDIDKLPSEVETTFPMVFYKPENKVYFIKSTDGDNPEVFNYSFEIFMTGPVGKTLEHRRRTVLTNLRQTNLGNVLDDVRSTNFAKTLKALNKTNIGNNRRKTIIDN